jgi:ABC-2 type transport system permease protein
MSALTGTGQLTRLALRRDRIMLPAWLLVFVALAYVSGSQTIPLYPTEADRVKAAAGINDAASVVALNGRIYDPTSLGALATVKLTGLVAVLLAVFLTILVMRHTRTEEETGRLELVGATAVGRHASLAAALLVAIGALVALLVLTPLALIGSGLEASGSVAFGLAWFTVGISFVAVAALTAQLTTSGRSAIGLSSAAIGTAFVLRAIGDTASTGAARWVRWLSPVGWGQQIRPYAGDRLWVALLGVAFAAGTTAVAVAVASRRDLGAGVLPDRPGPRTAARSLAGPVALAWRLQRGTLFAWLAGFVVLGLVVGNIASGVGDLLESQEARDLIAKLGGEKSLTDSFLAAELSLLGTIGTAYGVQAALRLRAEETGQRAEPLLATATSRVGWAASHVLMALLGCAALMTVAGLCAGVAYGISVDDPGRVGQVLVAALVQLPAMWLVVGIVVAAYGLVPRLAVAAWAFLVAFLLLGEFGPVLKLSQWVIDLSPWAHVPRLPGADVRALPLVMLVALAAVLTTGGLAAFRRRDLAP